MNVQLVESLLQTVLALPDEERQWFEQRLWGTIPYPSTAELIHLAQAGKAFDFLYDEPDLYTLEDGEPV